MSVRRCDDQTYTLATNATGTSAGVMVRGGEYTFTVEGTLTGTAALQMQTPNGAWATVAIFAASLVQTTTFPFVQTGIDLAAGTYRLYCSATGSGLYAYLIGLG